MSPHEKAEMIVLESKQLLENIDKFSTESTFFYGGKPGIGSCLGAIKSDIVKLRRDLLNLSKSLPEIAFGTDEFNVMSDVYGKESNSCSEVS